MAEENGTGAGEEEAAPALNPPAPIGGDDEEGGGAPEWMCTFSDLVTLLMCFFVLLFAMSTIQEETFKELVQSLKSALGVQQVPETGTREGLRMDPGTDTTDPQAHAVDELGGMVQKEMEEIVSDVRELIMFNKLGGQVRVEETEDGAVITIADMVIFGPGEAHLSEDGRIVMEKVAMVLAQFHYPVTVSGHTDALPMARRNDDSNWELSTRRATSVVRFLISMGIDPSQLKAQGFAHYRPVADNRTPEGRAKNRRVEITYERTYIARALSGGLYR
ncbi:OmpA/MotB family protein [Desulfoluna butyratoxydans]|uniref:Membrane motb of proton-channel complex mota/motb n=1 Tax=Desulfoluna butyratoxydans TaxID=231438 RepID=A0A4U8YL29_9BACT|nr:flagellar motor protein MotB [Desulfoluna butyratoxydans]VFQ44310.1 membrane motb of proton-channel complex mota/motb [Desulfoluna butyratoxydans]